MAGRQAARYSLAPPRCSSHTWLRLESQWSRWISCLSRHLSPAAVTRRSPPSWNSPPKCWRVSSITPHRLLCDKQKWCPTRQRRLCRSARCRNGLRTFRDACSRMQTFGSHESDVCVVLSDVIVVLAARLGWVCLWFCLMLLLLWLLGL